MEYDPDNRAPTPSLDDSGYSGPSSSPHDHWQGNTNLNIQMGANANANDPSLRYPTPERSEAGSPRVLSRSISRKDKNTTMKRRRDSENEDNDDDDEDEDEDNQNTVKRSRVRYLFPNPSYSLLSHPLVGLHRSTVSLKRMIARTSRQTRRKV